MIENLTESSINVTKSQLINAFTEWEREARANPDNFVNRLEYATPEEYGEVCAENLISYLIG